MTLDYGAPDGYGLHGQLTYTDDGTLVVCHECGQAKKALGLHVRVHGLTAREYRLRHGLSTGQGLAAPVTAARFSELGHSDYAMSALQEHRDPARARAGNTSEGRTRPQRRAVRQETARKARLGRDLTAHEVQQLAAAGGIAAWAAIAWPLVADGATRGSISRATGIGLSTVTHRMRRYPDMTKRPAHPEG